MKHSLRRTSIVLIVSLVAWVLTPISAHAEAGRFQYPCVIYKDRGHPDKHVHGTVTVKYRLTKDHKARVAWIYVTRTDHHHHSVKGPDYYYSEPWIVMTDRREDNGFGYMFDKLMADDGPMPRGRKPYTTLVTIYWDEDRYRWTHRKASCQVLV